MEQDNQFIEKKQWALSFMLMIALTLILFTATFILLNSRIEKVNNKIKEEALPVYKETMTTITNEENYTIKNFNDKIGIYLNGDFQYCIDNILISTLPEKDKQLLSDGINVTSKQELYEIISAYY